MNKVRLWLLLPTFVVVYFWGASPLLAEAEKSTEQAEVEVADDNVSGTPKIFFPEEIHDFGIVARGDKLTHHFKVQNTGDAPLKLVKAKAS